MNCRIPYIINTVKDSGLDEEYVSLATNAHKEVIEYLIGKNIVFHQERNGVKRLYLKHEYIDNPTVLEFLKAKGLYDDDENKSAIKFFNVEYNNKPYTYIGINVFNSPSLVDEGIPKDDLKIDTSSETRYIQELFVLPSIINLETHLQTISNKDNENILVDFGNEIVDKLNAYLISMKNVSDNYQLSVSKKEIDSLIRSLKDKDNQEIVKGIDNYVRQSVNKLNYLSQLFFGATSDYIKRQKEKLKYFESELKKNPDSEYIKSKIAEVQKTLDFPPKSIKQRLADIEIKRKSDVQQDKIDAEIELKDINDLLQQGRYFYHLFDNLSKLYTDIVLIDGNEKYIDKFNKRKLSDAIVEYVKKFNEENNTQLEANEIGYKLFNTEGNLSLSDLSEYLTKEGVANPNDFVYSLNLELSKLSRNKNTFLQVLKDSMNMSNVFKERMNDLYVDVFTSTFYPEYKDKMEEFKRKAFLDNEENYLTDKYFLEVDKFKEVVKVALKDVSTMSHYFRETIGLNDQITQLVTSFIKDMFAKVNRTNIEENAVFEKLRKEAKIDNLNSEDKEKFFDKFIFKTKKVALNKYGKIQDILKLSEEEQKLSKEEQMELLERKMKEQNADKKNKERGISYEPIKMFNEIYYVQMLDEEDIIKEYDDYTFRNEKLLFTQLLERKIREIFKKIPLKQMREDDIITVKNIFKELDVEYEIPLSEAFIKTGIDIYTDMEFFEKTDVYEDSLENLDVLKNIIQSVLWQSFYKTRMTTKSRSETKTILRENKIIKTKEDGILDFNYKALEESTEVKRNLASLSKKVENKQNGKYSTLSSRIKFSMDSLLGMEILNSEGNRVKRILVEKYDEETKLFYLDSLIYEEKGSTWKLIAGDVENITSFYTKKGELNEFNSRYKIDGQNAFPFDKEASSKFKAIESLLSQEKKIYDLLLMTKQKINEQLGNKRFYGLYNIPLFEQKTLKERALSKLNKIENQLDITYKENTEPKSRRNPETGKIEFLNEIDEVVEEEYAARVSKNKYGVDGKIVDEVTIEYSEYIPPYKREKDLLYAFSLMNSKVNNYALRTTLVPKLNTIRTIYSGDEKAGISKRKAYVLSSDGEKILDENTGKVVTVDADNLSENLEVFLKDMINGMSKKEYAIALGNVKIDMQKLVTNITGLSAYQALSLNFAAMPANHFISTISNYSEAAMGRNFNKKIFRETYRELFISFSQLKTFVADWSKSSFIEKSMLSQLSYYFNAIQGEFLDNKGMIHKENLAEKFMQDIWMATSNGTEYTNQLLTMVCLMKGWKQRDKDGNVVKKKNDKGELVESTLYNSVIHKEGELVQFEDWVTDDVKSKFSSLVQTINRQLHGNYNDQDRNLLSRTWYGRLMLVFKRWIYNTWMARFQSEQLDWESYTIEEGYYKTYLSKLISDYKDIFNKHGMKGFISKEIAPKYLRAMGDVVWKTGVESLRSGLKNLPILSMSEGYKSLFDSAKYDELIYGKDINERQKRAIERTSADLGLIIQMMMLGFLIHLASDDVEDEDSKKVLKWMEFYAFKMQAEMRFYTPFLYIPGQGLPASYTIDTAQRFAKDPFTMTRMIDVNLGLVRDLISVSMFNEEGDLELDWGANDLYEKNGDGYEKGDYKIVSKLEKSVISPYYQILRLMNPEQQLEYMDLIFKNN